MNGCIKFWGIVFSIWVLVGSCADDPDISVKNVHLSTYRVAVVMPAEMQKEWVRTSEWALSVVERAQASLPEGIRLKLEWHDESTIDVEHFFREAAQDKELAAIIGPYHSSTAMIAARYCIQAGKTLILPTASSVELQRLYSGRNFLWALSESDIAQCEALLTTALMEGAESVSLLATEDDYGDSFRDWFAFQATELKLKIGGVYTCGEKESLQSALLKIGMENNRTHRLICALSSPDDILALENEVKQMIETGQLSAFPQRYYTDVAYTREIMNQGLCLEGVSLSADPQFGFNTAYQVKFGEEPLNAEAHLYDAILLTAYGLFAKQMNGLSDLNEAFIKVVDGNETARCSWMINDVTEAFSNLSKGIYPDLSGATGEWEFDKKVHTVVLYSVYSRWEIWNEKAYILGYLTSDGSKRTESTLAGWNWTTTLYQEFDKNIEGIDFPPLDKCWAILVAASEGWSNYRHQADVLEMYQLLKRHGYDDDHIILIINDDLAYNEKNKYPGNVHVLPGGSNVYEDVKIDYKLDEISPDDLVDIIGGNTNERLPNTIQADEDDNILFFWSGHGGFRELSWGDSYVGFSAKKVREMLSRLHESKKYRKLFFPIEACYGGSIAEYCVGIPGVLFLTAANAYETSKADVKDSEMGIWLSNGFTRAFRETIDVNPFISLRDLYYKLARNTVGSHVTIYNESFFESVYDASMSDFLK